MDDDIALSEAREKQFIRLRYPVVGSNLRHVQRIGSSGKEYQSEARWQGGAGKKDECALLKSPDAGL
jgi:hypothetical protein